jgi:hypothetical protein
MASLALGAVGAGVGSMFGAASIGWSIGSFIGGQLFGDKGQDIKGPRLTDRSISSSSYGSIRPIIYSSYRAGGEIIWAADLREHKHKEEAGKGGGGGSYTSYTYTANFSMAVSAGPIVGIRKMWFDGKLVFSVADDASAAEIQVSAKIAKRIRVYLGSTTQEPDPLMESYLGSGNVPAYRGTAYLSFEELDVSKYGNRIPQITVEVVQSGAYSLAGTAISTGGASARQSLSLQSGVARAHSWHYAYDGTQYSDGIFEQRIYSLEDMSLVGKEVAYAVAGGDESYGWNYLYPLSMSPNAKFAIAEGEIPASNNTRSYYLFVNVGGMLAYVDILPMLTYVANYENGNGREYNLIWEDDYNVWFYKANSGDVYHYKIIVSLLGTIFVTYDRFNVDATRAGLDPLGGLQKFCLDSANGDIYVEISTNEFTPQTMVKRYTRDGDFIESKLAGITLSSFRGRLMAISDGILYDANGTTLRVYDWESETLLDSIVIANDSAHIEGAIMAASGNLLTILAEGNLYNFYSSLPNGTMTLDDVVSDICQRAGIATLDIDVTDLQSDIVRGFMIGNQSSARGALEQLAAAYFFDGRESDGVLEFVKRGDLPSVTLADDDIGCYEGSSVVELMDTERQQEEELPKALTFNYANVGADYQIGAQHSLRQSVLEGTEATIQLPIAFNDSEGKAIVDKMMFVAWQNRHSFILRAWQKYQSIDAADVISARGETMRVIARDEGVDGIIELRGVRELPYIYTGQVGSGATSGYISQTVGVNGPTQLKMLDIPPLRDGDHDRYGVYAAAAGYASGWTGAAIFKSSDGDNFDYMMSMDNAAIIGQITTALGDFSGGNVFDESNIVRVSVNGVLESKTRDQVLDGANVAIIGDEMIQFRTATLVSTGVYDLSGLLRGRMGTEWAMADHAIYEIFVLLAATSARFIPLPSGDFNVTKTWGAVSVGDTLEDIITDQFTYAGNNVKPLAPVHLGAGKTAHDGSWSITWIRSTRYGWEWVSGRDALLDEATEGYEVAILDNSGNILRTIDAATDSCTYTLDQQAEDFGGAKGSIDFKVRQTGALRDGEWSDTYTASSGFTTTTKLLLTTDGVDGSTDITDVYGNAISVAGAAQVSTAWSAFTNSTSITLDGSTGYLLLDNNNITISGDVTIEGFIYTTSVAAGYFGIFHMDGQLLLARKGSTIVLWYGSDQITSSTISAGVKYHVAVTRSGGTWRLFVNGTKAATDWIDSGTYGPVDIEIGRYLTSYFTGYIDDNFRVKVGEALYTANFIPPIEPFTG